MYLRILDRSLLKVLSLRAKQGRCGEALFFHYLTQSA